MVSRVVAWYHRITASEESHWAVAPLQAVVRWSIVFYKKLRRDRAFVRAAGMAYATLIALVPFLLLVFGILSATGLLENNKDTIEIVLFGTFLGDIPEVQEFLLPGLLAVDLNALGVAGVVGLVFVASRLMLMIEGAYSEIYGVPVERPFYIRILNIYFLVTALPLLALTVIITTKNTLSQVDVDTSGLSLTMLSPLVLFGVFLGALKLFPNTRVRWRPALVGALVSTVLVSVLSRIFPWYVSVFGSDDPLRIIYGSVGIIPVFLLWLYLLWMFVLFGVETAYVIQNYSSLVLAEQEAWEQERSAVQALDVSVAVEVAMRVAKDFEAGTGPTDPEELAHEMSLSVRRTWEVLAVLTQDGLLVKTDECYTMARPPSTITVAQVVGGWRRNTSVRGSGDPVSSRIYEALVREPEGTLHDAVERWLLAKKSAEEPAASAATLDAPG